MNKELEKTLSAGMLRVLLDCYTGVPFGSGETSGYINQCIKDWTELKMLDENRKVTEKGKVWIEHILQTPMPKRKYVMEARK